MPAQNDIWYQLSSGKWGSISKDLCIPRNDIVNLYYQLYNVRIVPKHWVFNDFGPVAIRWFKDNNGNKVLDGTERLSGQMFHTTPDNEAEHAQGLPVAFKKCMRLQGAADTRRRTRSRTAVLQASGNAADVVPCERIHCPALI